MRGTPRSVSYRRGLHRLFDGLSENGEGATRDANDASAVTHTTLGKATYIAYFDSWVLQKACTRSTTTTSVKDIAFFTLEGLFFTSIEFTGCAQEGSSTQVNRGFQNSAESIIYLVFVRVSTRKQPCSSTS